MTRRDILQYGTMTSLGLMIQGLNFPFPNHNTMTDTNRYEVIIIGGSYAGLSAAMALGRSLRKVLIIDGGQPCNRQTPHAHNFLTHDGSKPADISREAKSQVLEYPTVKFITDFASAGKKSDSGFEISTINSGKFIAEKLIFATGVKDIMPDIRGFSECWGISVIHCPYCHGYEHKGQKTAIMANGERAFHLASLVNNLTDDLTILTNGKSDFDEGEFHKLDQHGISINEKIIQEIIHNNGEIKQIVFDDQSREDFSTMYGAIPFVQHTDIPSSLGCELTEHGHVKVDFMFKTSIDGVYACGDNSSPFRSIANAVYGGNVAGAVLNMELTKEQF